MVQIKEVINFFNNYLNPEKVTDFTYNGLQIEGKEEIRRIGFSVDSCLDVYEKAYELKCDMLVVHHGLIWGGLKKIAGSDKKRIDFLLKNNINLYVSHLPLDKHPEVGNNVQILKFLKARIVSDFGDVGYIGELNNPLYFEDLLILINKIINNRASYLNFSSEKIKKVAVCSGEINLSLLNEAIDRDVSTILTGEGKGQSLFYYPAKENNLNIIFAGHYQTEIFGIKALMQKTKEHFNKHIEVCLIDIPNTY